jgi:hypothetical protein
MKAAWIGAAITEDQAARTVWIAKVEVGMLHELTHDRQNMAVVVRRAGLQAKPFVDHQGLIFEQGMEVCQSLGGQFMSTAYQCNEGIEAVGHVVSIFEGL